MFNSYLFNRIPNAIHKTKVNIARSYWRHSHRSQAGATAVSSKNRMLFLNGMSNDHFIHSFIQTKCIQIESIENVWMAIDWLSPLRRYSSCDRWALAPMTAANRWQSPNHCTTSGIFDLSMPLTTEIKAKTFWLNDSFGPTVDVAKFRIENKPFRGR